MTRLGRNSAVLLAAAGAVGLLGWLQLKWLALHLGAAGMGTFAVLFSAGSVLTLVLQAGLALLVTRWVARLESEARAGAAARVTLACLGWTVVAGTVVSAAVAAFPAAVAGAWAPLGRAPRALPWVALFFSASSVRMVLYAVWNGRRQMHWPALVEMAQLAAVTAALYLGRVADLAGFFRFNAATSALATAGCAGALLPGLLRARGGSFGPSEGRELAAYAGWSFFVSATGVGFEYADRLVLAARLSAAEVSYFHVPARWLQFVRRLLAQPLNALFPELARGPLGGRREAFQAFVQLFSVCGLGAGLALALSPGAFIRLLASPEFDRGIPILRVLALVPPLMVLYGPLTTALRAGGSMRQGAVSDALWVVTYLGFGALALRSLGSLGLAVGQVLASLVALAWNLGAGRPEDRLGLPWAALVRQWAAAAVALGLGWLAPGGETGWWRALAGDAAFVVLVRLGGGLSREARAQVRARLPERLRGVFGALAGS